MGVTRIVLDGTLGVTPADQPLLLPGAVMVPARLGSQDAWRNGRKFSRYQRILEVTGA